MAPTAIASRRLKKERFDHRSLPLSHTTLGPWILGPAYQYEIEYRKSAKHANF